VSGTFQGVPCIGEFNLTGVPIDITVLAHPDVWFRLGRFKTHISETTGEVFVPAQTRSPEAVHQCLEDNQGMPLAFSKLGTSNEEDEFERFGL
jgi:hypothetical protein